MPQITPVKKVDEQKQKVKIVTFFASISKRLALESVGLILVNCSEPITIRTPLASRKDQSRFTQTNYLFTQVFRSFPFSDEMNKLLLIFVVTIIFEASIAAPPLNLKKPEVDDVLINAAKNSNFSITKMHFQFITMSLIQSFRSYKHRS